MAPRSGDGVDGAEPEAPTEGVPRAEKVPASEADNEASAEAVAPAAGEALAASDWEEAPVAEGSAGEGEALADA